MAQQDNATLRGCSVLMGVGVLLAICGLVVMFGWDGTRGIGIILFGCAWVITWHSAYNHYALMTRLDALSEKVDSLVGDAHSALTDKS